MSTNYTLDKFTIRNYRSFCDEQSIDFNNESPVMAFYGANASGKTNLYSALTIFTLYIKQSINPDSHGVPHAPFLLRIGMNQEPTVFTLHFHNDTERYRYTVSVKGDRVVEESMYDLSSSRERTIFIRSKGATDLAARNGFGKKMFEGNEAARDDSLLITLAQQTKNKYANAVFAAIDNIINITLMDSSILRGPVVKLLQEKPDLFKRVLDLLRKADFTIEDFSYGSTKITPEMLADAPFKEAIIQQLLTNGRNTFINTVHSIRDKHGDKKGAVTFDMERQESLGTNNFFNIIVPILDAIDGGKTIYIDEFGSSLHTSICQFIIRLFKKEGVKTGAKLLINTHDVGLIKNLSTGVLEKNEIMLIEKDRFEQTIITPLAKKMKRPDDNIGKKYTIGVYGGIPIIEETEE